MRKKSNPSSDLRGAGRLTVDAIKGIIDLVEAVHRTILSLGGLIGGKGQKRTTGITGMVYRNIRSTTGLVGRSIDSLLSNLTFMVEDRDPSPERDAVVAVLNGVLGDHLADKENPLAIPMQLKQNGKPLVLVDKSTLESVKTTLRKIVLLIHGSCMNDQQWNRQGHDHGLALERDLGYAPFYLHYNSGLHISENGKKLADMLEVFMGELPVSAEFTIIAHSMGGLVARSAYHYGEANGLGWLSCLKKLIFLGTPHHGAPLERGGNWIDNILEISPYSAPFSRLGKIRSAGITDLRYGNVVDGDWTGRDRFEPAGDQRLSVPLPVDIDCYAIAGTTANVSSKIGDKLIGDGLVPLNSALGRSKNPNLTLLFLESHQWIGRNIKHLDLLNHQDVYEIIKKWLS